MKDLKPIGDITELYPQIMRLTSQAPEPRPAAVRKPVKAPSMPRDKRLRKELLDSLDDSKVSSLSNNLIKWLSKTDKKQEENIEEEKEEELSVTDKKTKKETEVDTDTVDTDAEIVDRRRKKFSSYLTSKNTIAQKESSNNYDAISPNSSATGKYQFLWGVHGDKIKEVTGVKSREEFLNSPEAQEEYYNYWDKNTLTPAVKKYGKALRGKLGDGLTDAQIKEAVHFAGEGNIRKAIKSGDFDLPLDANGTSISKYLGLNNTYSMGGTIHIKPSHEGRFTAWAKRHGLSMSEAIRQGKKSKDPSVRKMATFADNARHFKHALGGTTESVPVEVEGNEGIQTPDGNYMEVQGPSHENGGVPMSLPEGSEVYSDRLSINGKTMKERKDAREKVLKRIEKAMDKHPSLLRKKTLQRVLQANAVQEEKDLALMEAANKMYPSPGEQKAMGGQVPWTQLFKGVLDIGTQLMQGSPDEIKNPLITENAGMRPYANGGIVWEDSPFDTPLILNLNSPSLEANGYSSFPVSDIGEGLETPAISSYDINKGARVAAAPDDTGMGFTTGDYIGMAGNTLGSIAPLLLTLANRKGDTPNVNSYKNFGKDALEANSSATDYINNIKANQLEDLRIQRNTAKASNRGSARSIQTIRALDTVSDLAYNQGSNSIYSNYAASIINNLGQRAGLLNQRDQFVMSGEHQRDLADRQDRDAYFSNLNQDVNNLATGVQAQGKYFNQGQERNDFLELLPELSKYGLGVVYKNGKPVLEKVR